MPQDFGTIEDDVERVSREVLVQMQGEFERLKSDDPAMARSFEFGFANAYGELASDGSSHHQAPVKYLIKARSHVRKFYRFLPHIAHVSSVFEIGVGPGHLLKLLRDGFDVDIHGCDIEFERTMVYDRLRRALGIDRHVQEHVVTPYTEIPIRAGTEAVLAFWTAFNTKWKVREHEWFLDFLGERLCGRKLVAIRFNPKGFNDNPDVERLYHRRGNFPLNETASELGGNFCVLEL